MANTPIFSLRLYPGLRGALDEIAKTEHRSVGNLINRALEGFIVSHGFQVCDNCGGHPANFPDEDGNDPDLCDVCDGLGYVPVAARLQPRKADKGKR